MYGDTEINLKVIWWYYLTSKYNFNDELKKKNSVLVNITNYHCQVIGTAAQELSRPVDPSTTTVQEVEQKVQEVSACSDDPDTWRDVVQRRIDSKTRRFGQGKTRPDPRPTENRFSSVAGYFFYPLMKNFDRLLFC
jgi:telomere length regulation protein